MLWSANAFKGKGAAQIKNTNYREKNWNYSAGLAKLGPQGWSMATETPTDVAVNRQGDFYNLGPPNGVVNDPTTGKTYTLAPGAELDAFEILHELTHQLNLGVNDYQNPLGQQANNLYVLQNCW